MAGCKGTEICPHFDMHPDTFYRKVEERYSIGFTELCRIKREQGDSLLRETQFYKAIGETDVGDNTMLIWLGKQRLDQREPEAVRAETALSEPITVALSDIKDLNGSVPVQSESSPIPPAGESSP